jgi:hypothetical protein
MIRHSGLNSGGEHVRESKHFPLAFELATDVVRDTSTADAARKLNLVKANAARLRIRRERGEQATEHRSNSHTCSPEPSEELPRAA